MNCPTITKLPGGGWLAVPTIVDFQHLGKMENNHNNDNSHGYYGNRIKLLRAELLTVTSCQRCLRRKYWKMAKRFNVASDG